MQTMKRVEIVTDSVELPAVLRLVLASGATGYTVIRDVVGQGGRGLRDGEDPAGALKNSLILVACPGDVASRIIEGIRPVLKRYGGVCLVSDAQYILH